MARITKREQIAGVDGVQSAKKIGNNTLRITYADGREAIRLHTTDILTFKDGRCTYNSGGWRTITTKDRMNQYGPARITQAAGIWYIDGKVYQDGCWVKGGRVHGAAPAGLPKRARKELKQIREYCREFMDAFFAYKIPAPSGGDCWGCLMKAEDGSRPLGRDGQHVRDHVKERYFVPSLLVAACEAFPISAMAKNMFFYAWNPEGVEKRAADAGSWLVDIARRQMTSSLYRYCKRAYKIAA